MINTTLFYIFMTPEGNWKVLVNFSFFAGVGGGEALFTLNIKHFSVGRRLSHLQVSSEASDRQRRPVPIEIIPPHSAITSSVTSVVII